MASHITGCPISMRTWKGESYANFIDDCLYCKYYVGDDIGSIYCTGKKDISTCDDLMIYINEMKKKNEEADSSLRSE